MAEEPSLSFYLPIAGGRIIGFIPFPGVLVLCEMQSVSSRIWTRIAVFISYGDNDYTTGTNSLVTVLSAPITIGIMFCSFFFVFFLFFLIRSKYLSLFLLSFSFTLWSAAMAKSIIQHVLIFVDYHKVWSSGCDQMICLYLPNPKEFCAFHFLGQILGCAYTICSYG